MGLPHHRGAMSVKSIAIVVAGLLVLGFGFPTPGQENAPEPEVFDQTGDEVDVSYAPGPAYPFGRPHPDAPAELEQFAFMVGEFDCVDEMRQKDGSFLRFRAIWNARYFLNGFGIQDEYWTPRFFTSNIRIYDPKSKQWQVTFFRMPGYQSGVWQGKKEGNMMVMRRDGRTIGPGLTFYDISEDGFRWHSGGETPGWTSTCKRRR
jgi:hypothetical protein